MPLADQEFKFHIEEYKSLRGELIAKIKDVRDLSRWGVIGLAALYSYILTNLDKRWLFWVPVGLSLMIMELVREEHRMVLNMALYIKEKLEHEMAAEREFDGIQGKARGGWERFLAPTGQKVPPWRWEPMPVWIALFFFTLIVAVLAFFFDFIPVPPKK